MFRAALAALVFLALSANAAPAAAQDLGEYAFTQDYEPSPAIWRVADEDTTIWMFGTYHVLPRGFRWRSERLDAIIEEAEMLVVETSDYDIADDAIDIDTKLEARLASREPTSQRLSSAARMRWRQLIHLSGQDFDAIDEMPVLLALLSLSMTSGEAPHYISSNAYGVETVLESAFAVQDKPILSIEDAGGVMYSLLRLDGDELIADLDGRLVAWASKKSDHFYDPEHVAKTGDAYWETEHAWARGVVAEHFDMGFGDGAIGVAFDGALLARRNTAWAEWIETRLEEPGTILLAVGAGHFEGDVSVQVKLAERGIATERVE
ncbi:MAG: TraB/GumN family protein [Alteraurantiacibacter sp.]